MSKVEVCDQSVVSQYVWEANHFFQEILDMPEESVLYTDESLLSDFSFRGATPDPELMKGAGLSCWYAAWDELILNKIERVYGFRPKSTVISLIELFEQVKKSFAGPTIH